MTSSERIRKGKQLRKYITATWSVGETSKSKQLAISYVKAGAVPGNEDVVPEVIINGNVQEVAQEREPIDTSTATRGLEWKPQSVPLPLNGAVEQWP